MIFIDIFLFKINEIILLIIAYHNFEDLEEEEEENHDTIYNNYMNFLDNEYSDQENWFNGE